MILVFDTSALSGLFRNDDRLIRLVSHQDYDCLVIPIAVDVEMRFGFAHGAKHTENLANYELFKKQFGAELAHIDQDTAIHYAELAVWARKNGVALSHNDLWIASTCVQRGGKLFSLDQDFARLPQVSLVSLDI